MFWFFWGVRISNKVEQTETVQLRFNLKQEKFNLLQNAVAKPAMIKDVRISVRGIGLGLVLRFKV